MQTLQIGNDWLTDRPGGLNRYYYELLAHLPQHGVGVRGLIVGSPCIAEATKGAIVPFAQADQNLLSRWIAARKAGLHAIQAKPDLISIHFSLYAVPLVDQLKNFPTLLHFHGPWAGESQTERIARMGNMVKRAIEKAVYDRSGSAIVLSQAFHQELVRRFEFPEERVSIIPGGVDAVRFNATGTRAEAREQLGWPRDRRIILAVRRQVRRMGLENLIDATRLLVHQHPDLLVMLGGSGPIAKELKQRIDDHGLQEHIKLLGRINDADLPLAYRAAEMSVIPTQTLEGFGLITLESLACGTPVFTTPIGGLPETVQPFAPQCVFEGTSTDSIRSGLDAALRGSIHVPRENACRAYAETNFAWPVIAGRIADHYRKAIA